MIKRGRGQEISQKYFNFLDDHIEKVITGEVQDFFELNEIASRLAISHQHLSDTIKAELGHHPCHFYDLKIIEKAKEMLLKEKISVSEVARRFTYDPSNFSKFFKNWTGETPGSFRKKNI
ncbi:helix-turn-helix domain-containing protein [Chryseobacterium sp. Leaf394]|uniref:helix-turn-helix domain-containing protein n=1 Tax=Chryseobacterium sp. Leaf394 TaxID=1736361 RepID=UPI0006F3B706|nr:helix-turn-helix domain-containing protein [Chryseobacterium sp. Leaf394]KQS92261.1 DNA-binding protein [Chryseobacterium sp. Leaf394]